MDNLHIYFPQIESTSQSRRPQPIYRSENARRNGIDETNISHRLRPRNEIAASFILLDNEPESYQEAISLSDKENWIKAIQEELCALIKNHTWSVEDLPENRKPISVKW